MSPVPGLLLDDGTLLVDPASGETTGVLLLGGGRVPAAYTGGSAYAGFQEAQRRHLRPGARAALAVLDGDPRAATPARTSPAVLLGVVGGEVVYYRRGRLQ